MITDREHLHAVPNNNNQNGNGNGTATADLVKTVAITSLVSSLVGVFAVAGGQALWHLIRRAIVGKPKKRNESEPPPQQNPPWWATPPEERGSADPPWWSNPAGDEEEIPPSLRHQPRFRGGRRRRPNGATTPAGHGPGPAPAPVEQNFDMRAAFADFATKFDARMANLERKVDEFDYEEEEGE